MAADAISCFFDCSADSLDFAGYFGFVGCFDFVDCFDFADCFCSFAFVYCFGCFGCSS